MGLSVRPGAGGSSHAPYTTNKWGARDGRELREIAPPDNFAFLFLVLLFPSFNIFFGVTCSLLL